MVMMPPSPLATMMSLSSDATIFGFHGAGETQTVKDKPAVLCVQSNHTIGGAFRDVCGYRQTSAKRWPQSGGPMMGIGGWVCVSPSSNHR
jgi:hypothetical protein